MADGRVLGGRAFSIYRQPGFAFIAATCFVLLYVPIAVLTVYSFYSGVSIAVWDGVSLRWYEVAWRKDIVQEAAVRSLIKVATGYYGLGYLIAAQSAFCIPFAYLPIRARLENMDLSLERAAADLYATPWMTFRRVTLPLMLPGIMAGAMLAFVISLDDVVITELVKSAGQETLPTYMLGQLRRVITPEMNAIATVFLALSVTLVTIFFFLSRKRP